MKTTQNRTAARSIAIVGVAIALVIFLAGAYGPLPVASGQGRPSDTPAASIDKIVVRGTNVTDALGNVIVTRANTEKVQPVTTGLLLYRGDTIETLPNTQLTVIFLETPVPEKHNQIIIDGDAKVGISSGDSWWGRVWTKVSGLFTSKTTYVKVGAVGTEYELNVSKDGRQTTLVMLEGDFLDVTRGTFTLAGQVASIEPVQKDAITRTPQFITTSFDRENSTQEQVGRAMDVRAGEITPLEVTYNITNGCSQRHRFEFRTSDNTPWLQLEVQKIWEIAPKQRRAIPARLNIDARQMAVGAHRGHVYLVCLDCNQEALCPGSQLDWPYYVTVLGPGTIVTPSPTPPAAATPTPFRITELQEVVIPSSPEPASPQRTSDARVRAALEWTNGVILKTQPTYSAEGLFPHFAAVEQRSQNFRTAREQAILRHSPGSNKVLGDIYSDWGQAGQAAKAYEIERKNSGGPQNSVDSAEAQRLIGKPDQAREMILGSADSRSAAAQNLLGNVYADYARIALDKRNWAQARTDLETAEGFYRSALSSPAPGRPRAAAGDGPVQANLAKTQISQGDLLLKEALGGSSDPQAALAGAVGLQTAAAQQARTKYASAVQLLSTTQPAETTYPFGVQNLGRAHQGLGDAAMLAGEPAAAADSFANAKAHYNRVISAHPDCAEAYFSLGDLYEDMGDKENAKLNYRRAIQTRPEQPASYYPLAMLLQTEDPKLARALAATYLQLEPEVFKQGEKARNAERITRGEQVPPTTRIGTTKPTGSVVPGVVSMTQNEAVNRLTAAGFVANVQTRNDPQFGNVVLEQKPAGGSSAQRGSTVVIVVNNPNRPLIVPNVIAKSEPDARAAIEGAGLRVGSVARRIDSRAVGTVLEQRPAAGSSAERGSAIEIIVSGGGEPVVPNVVNMSEADARAAIQNVGLRIGDVRQRSEDNKPKGSVVRQEPSAGKRVVPGSPVNLTVSAGKLVDVPKIINDKEDTAKRKIGDKGLTVVTSYRPVSQRDRNCESVGKVLEQTPPPSGNKVEVGSTVNIVIGTVGEDPVTVPNFVGSNGRDVAADREQRFILARPKTEETDDAPPGTVIKQSPSAGTQIARDCPIRVELTVAEPLTSVGNYVGLYEAEARRQVSETRLIAVVRTSESQSEPGRVIDQSPPAGSRVRRSFPITLVVSVRRVPPILVPDVEKKYLIEAKNILEGVGLRLGAVRYVEPQPSVFTPGRGPTLTDVPECTVTRQDPIKDSQVPPGTPVNVWVLRLKGSNVNCLNPNRDVGDR
jgi:beta-lactam-binding protein with PASTA domain/tetratricopeptide (TPR) repeat protein